MNGEYEGEEIDPDSNKSHEEKTYTVNFSLWNFLRLKNLLVIKQHYTGSSNEDYLRDWESRFYVPEFNYLFLHGHYEYQGDYDDWGFHNIQLNPNKQEIAVELISKNKESEGKYLLKKVD